MKIWMARTYCMFSRPLNSIHYIIGGMIMMKKFIAVILMLAMVFCMAACSSSGSDETETDVENGPEEAVSGGWEMASNDAAALPEDVQKAFDGATEKLTGNELKPVAYVANQVVAGMNYMILCEGTPATADPKPVYQMAVIYADLEGNAEMTSIVDFDYVSFTEGDDQEEQEMLAGGWSAAEDAAGSEIPEEVLAAYEKATDTVDWTWSKVEPLAYLGSQLVAGTNYALLCKGEPSSDEKAGSIMVLTVYEDLEGNAEITNIHVLDLTEFSGQ